MKPRCLLSAVDRLPTISELQESDVEDDPDLSLHDYASSIRELSQPAPYPRQGPLRGHRRWMVRTSTRAPTVPAAAFAPWIPVEVSDVSFSLTERPGCEPLLRHSRTLLEQMVVKSQFAGLV
ncbi:uncharacterized protein si:ch73-6k14.2 [Synchiropus splendidus]|uniref:uncharacterized protein si:ch73-6k14.2 n=1 Tax=Synchiropus splendidus TaxID=270530 RepID=UPI00237EB63C|nr:uncharacterized protein si:ch73-6k14.2 [Synchiropus splendidus]